MRCALRLKILLLLCVNLLTLQTCFAQSKNLVNSFQEQKKERIAHLQKKEFNCIDGKEQFIPGQVLVKYRDTEKLKTNLLQLKPKFSFEKLISAQDSQTKLFENIYLVTDKSIFDNYKINKAYREDHCNQVLDMIQEIKKDPNVEIVEPNLVYKLLSNQLNDPLLNGDINPPGLWGLEKINIEKAWELSNGDSIIVAVLDSGVDYNHPDLLNNIPYFGYDYVYGDQDPEDGTGHGTHVAGTIGMTGNNSKGGAGVAYKAKIFPVRVINSQGSVSGDIIKALSHAASNGAKVINLSFGGSFYSAILDQAYNLIYESGIALIAASGNDGVNTLFYPAGYASVLAVASTNQNDQLSSFSNYGSWVDIAAPGENILSTWSSNAYLECIASNPPQDWWKCTGNAGRVKYSEGEIYGYATNNGTSMACPHVSGVVALLLSYYNKFTINDIFQILYKSVDPISPSGAVISGRVNAGNALKLALRLRALANIDIDRDLNISDNELLRLASSINSSYGYLNKDLDLNNSGGFDENDIELFRSEGLFALDDLSKLNFEKYFQALYQIDSQKPYGVFSSKEKIRFKKKIQSALRKKIYIKDLDVNFDDVVNLDDYLFAINVLGRLSTL
jgi:thermitase